MSPRVRESWDDVCLKSYHLNLPILFVCKRSGIVPARAKQYNSGRALPDEKTVNKISQYLTQISEKRKKLYAV